MDPGASRFTRQCLPKHSLLPVLVTAHRHPVFNRPRPEALTELRKSRDIAYTTVMTVMDTLHGKGWLRRRLEGRAYRYEAVASREAYTARSMRGAPATSDNQAAAFVHFLAELTPRRRRRFGRR